MSEYGGEGGTPELLKVLETLQNSYDKSTFRLLQFSRVELQNSYDKSSFRGTR